MTRPPTPRIGEMVYWYPIEKSRHPELEPCAALVAKVDAPVMRIWVLDPTYGNHYEFATLDRYGTERGCWSWPDFPSR